MRVYARFFAYLNCTIHMALKSLRIFLFNNLIQNVAENQKYNEEIFQIYIKKSQTHEQILPSPLSPLFR